MNGADIILVFMTFTDGSAGKVRPAVVVSSDVNNARTDDVTIAPLTSNTSRAASVPGQVLVDVTTPDGQAAGIPFTSVVRCDRVTTVHKMFVSRIVGRMPSALMSQIDAALKVALDLP